MERMQTIFLIITDRLSFARELVSMGWLFISCIIFLNLDIISFKLWTVSCVIPC